MSSPSVPKPPPTPPPIEEAPRDIELRKREEKRLASRQSSAQASLLAGADESDKLFGKNSLLGGPKPTF